MGRFDSSNDLYGGTSISSFDPGHMSKLTGGSKGNTITGGTRGKSIENKSDDSVLMNNSIKKVMQKNRELHKQVVKLQLENDKLTAENTKYKKIVDKYKSR
tara:strand:+ start:1461 stop:1763 length:303 start_codon:yes stop_codon:yes gene_type:complete